MSHTILAMQFIFSTIRATQWCSCQHYGLTARRPWAFLRGVFSCSPRVCMGSLQLLWLTYSHSSKTCQCMNLMQVWVQMVVGLSMWQCFHPSTTIIGYSASCYCRKQNKTISPRSLSSYTFLKIWSMDFFKYTCLPHSTYTNLTLHRSNITNNIASKRSSHRPMLVQILFRCSTSTRLSFRQNTAQTGLLLIKNTTHHYH